MKFSVVVTDAYSSHIRAAWPVPVTRKTISWPSWLDLGAERAEHLDVRVDLARAERAALDLVLEPRLAETRRAGRGSS